jgi:hypothetical protein
MGRACGMMGVIRSAYKVLGKKTQKEETTQES